MVIDAATDTYVVEEWGSGFHKNSKKQLFLKPNILQGASLLLHKSLESWLMPRSVKNTPEWSIIASEDDICVLFFHVVLYLSDGYKYVLQWEEKCVDYLLFSVHTVHTCVHTVHKCVCGVRGKKILK